MKSFKHFLEETKRTGCTCWTNYKRVPGTKPCSPGSCVKEATDYYPREGFPKEGEYGYHPNPGLKPQESDKDEDMDKAYKAANSKEAKKPLNAKKIEVSNKVKEEAVNESAAWQRKEGKNPEGGLNRKGIASYRRENPGSKLSMAVTTKPSKLDPDSKPAKRRKSFCARMGGMKGPMKDENGKPTRKALALRKWNCN